MKAQPGGDGKIVRPGDAARRPVDGSQRNLLGQQMQNSEISREALLATRRGRPHGEISQASPEKPRVWRVTPEGVVEPVGRNDKSEPPLVSKGGSDGPRKPPPGDGPGAAASSDPDGIQRLVEIANGGDVSTIRDTLLRNDVARAQRIGPRVETACNVLSRLSDRARKDVLRGVNDDRNVDRLLRTLISSPPEGVAVYGKLDPYARSSITHNMIRSPERAVETLTALGNLRPAEAQQLQDLHRDLQLQVLCLPSEKISPIVQALSRLDDGQRELLLNTRWPWSLFTDVDKFPVRVRTLDAIARYEPPFVDPRELLPPDVKMILVEAQLNKLTPNDIQQRYASILGRNVKLGSGVEVTLWELLTDPRHETLRNPEIPPRTLFETLRDVSGPVQLHLLDMAETHSLATVIEKLQQIREIDPGLLKKMSDLSWPSQIFAVGLDRLEMERMLVEAHHIYRAHIDVYHIDAAQPYTELF